MCYMTCELFARFHLVQASVMCGLYALVSILIFRLIFRLRRGTEELPRYKEFGERHHILHPFSRHIMDEKIKNIYKNPIEIVLKWVGKIAFFGGLTVALVMILLNVKDLMLLMNAEQGGGDLDLDAKARGYLSLFTSSLLCAVLDPIWPLFKHKSFNAGISFGLDITTPTVYIILVVAVCCIYFGALFVFCRPGYKYTSQLYCSVCDTCNAITSDRDQAPQTRLSWKGRERHGTQSVGRIDYVGQSSGRVYGSQNVYEDYSYRVNTYTKTFYMKCSICGAPSSWSYSYKKTE